MSVKLKAISIAGWKTIQNLDRFEPRPLNVLIGTNAAGKSNFIGFFRFLQWMLTRPGQLQLHIKENGGANSLLHYGSERTQQINAGLELETERGLNEYEFQLSYTADDSLVFARERYRYSRVDLPTRSNWINLPAASLEAGLVAKAESGERTAEVMVNLIRRCVVHQFHNTSRTARIKQHWSEGDNYYLKEDAANLAPFLLRLREHEPASYQRVVETIRIVFPLFADFELNVVGGKVALQWREQGTDLVFDAFQVADGLLRFFAMCALLLQPVATLPDVLLIDEPELGLHPHALEVLAGLLRRAAVDAQVIVSTQSATLVGQFETEDIVVVDRHEGASRFRRLGESELSDWLDDFTLGELWQKNYIEGATNG